MMQIKSNLLPFSRHASRALFKGAKLGVKYGPRFIVKSTPVAMSLYLQYKVAKEAFNTATPYIGKYSKVKEALALHVQTPKVFGSLFKKSSSTLLNWNILKLNFNPYNLREIQNILDMIYEKIDDVSLMQKMTAQVLAKLLMNFHPHFLEEGTEIKVPTINEQGEKELTTYSIEKKFDLWKKVPAFGLVDKKGEKKSLLLFRATNTDVYDVDFAPTVIANLHPKGPAWKLFSHSEKQISEWLKEQGEGNTKVVGFSQGGVLAAYYLIFYAPYFSQSEIEPSYIFDAPGVRSSVAAYWDKLNEKPFVQTFVTRGDIIPKVGTRFIGKAYEIKTKQKLKGTSAHRALTMFASEWKMSEIATEKEQRSKTRSVISNFQKVLGRTIYTPVKKLLLPCFLSMHS